MAKPSASKLRAPAQRLSFTPGSWALSALLGCSALVIQPATAAEPPGAGTTRAQELDFAIPAMSLDDALAAYGIATNVQVLYPAGLTQGLRSGPATGRLTREQALAQILAGSGLSFRFTDQRSVTLQGREEAAGAPDSPLEMAPVVISGEKINRTLEQTQTSVVVNGAADFAEHGDNTLNDVFARTPGVYTQPGNKNWGIRGVPVSGFDDQGPATLNGAVSVFVDGAQLPNRALTLSPLPLWDIEQVEVLMGPQSTTQGRNSLAGAVVVQTRNPSFTPSASVRTNVGDYGTRGAAAAAGGALMEGVLAGRIAVDYQQSDGYIENLATNDDANIQRNSNVRGKLLFLPNDDMDVLLGYAHSENRQGVNASTRQDGRVRFYRIDENSSAYDKMRQDTGTAKIDYRLDDAWTLTSLTAITRSDYNALLDFDQTSSDLMEAIRSQDTRMFSQELRLGYEATDLRGFVGLYYGHTRNDYHDLLTSDGAPFGTVQGDTRIDNRALFGELNWTFQPGWTLITGARLDSEHNDTRVDQDDFSSPGDASKRFSAFLPKLGLDHELAANQYLGVMVQKGYRGGGVNVRAGGGHAAYDPEYTTNYELSYRGAWQERTLRLRANLYYTQWKDQQVSMLDSSGNFFQVYNAGRSTIRGLETFLEKDFGSSLSLNAGLAYTDGRYRDFMIGETDLGGKSFLYSPKYKASAGIVYRFANGLSLGSDLLYQDGAPSEYQLADNGQVVHQRKSDYYTLVNLNTEYQLGHGLTLSGYVKNLFDKDYITNDRSGDFVDVGAPRTFTVALQYDL
ncbi:outer membrane receptor protein involved in Fe transport [Pseudomonas nitritireducens]|uniref:Outer membrane receptor protein involved in Fe transport n=1 Tax=Pseudomonas nitroreducens TaxID=46680 RepID=A0A7W7KNQ5_PSENT|nr:outer membrane receptor protein involved in Fe transport [Pseudomonas nitritireducens]